MGADVTSNVSSNPIEGTDGHRYSISLTPCVCDIMLLCGPARGALAILPPVIPWPGMNSEGDTFIILRERATQCQTIIILRERYIGTHFYHLERERERRNVTQLSS